SWRGFSDALYYHQNDSGEYLDVSGCGNSIAANRPIVRQLILESMRCWAIELGVDGFRFDLGIALSRGEGLKPLENPPLFEEIEADPELSDLKLFSEPWDCGGLYRLSDFPAQRIGTWNGHYRDDLRAFWKGDEDSAWRMGQRLSGSADLYKGEPAPLGRSLNFITAHDGFTLNDLVSFNRKHNLANGESNRDGENHNNSWNNGIEGPCSDHAVQALRHRQMRNLIATLLLSRGVPMLLMGDEVGRSQGGNNNSWCQDNPLGWMLWNPEQCDMDLHLFVSRLLMIRHQLSELFSPINHPPEERPVRLQQSPDDLWLQWHGVEIDKPDWGSWSHTICYSLNRGSSGAVMWMGFNAYSKAMHFDLPEPTSAWHRILDTA
ncbi:MAG: glycogen-debranching protein, partial [Cyanobacteriota bacterium]|nr:glycogen-debranching protein [Cyanobacteriota bacterium]